MNIIQSRLLFTPGPTDSPEFMRIAMAAPTLHHRTSEFENIFAYVREKLKIVTKMQENLIISSSGTGAMEASVAYFCKKKALVLNSGKFGERFGKIVKSQNKEAVEIINEWHTPASAEQVKEALEKNKDIDSIFFQICESAGGLKHHYKEIAQTIKEFNENIFVIADAITAMGVEDIDIKHIDCLIGGSQKAFMLPPGLSFLGLSKKAIEEAESNDIGYYFNLSNELKNQRKNTTAYTVATTIVIGLKSYFRFLEYNKLSLHDIYENTAKIANATRCALSAINLQIYPKNPANAMTTIYHENAKDIRKYLESIYHVKLAGGQDKLKDTIFRINHMGLVNLSDMLYCINAIELTLENLNIRKFDGEANKVFLSNYKKG